MDHIKNRNEAALLRMKIEDQKLLYERTMKEQQLLYEEKLRSLKSEAELTSTKNYLMYGHSDDYKSLRSHSKDN